jgi:hypothetical protein
MQFNGEAIFVIGSRSSGEALAQLYDFFCAGAAPANFRATAGCGHKVLLGMDESRAGAHRIQGALMTNP